MCNCFFRKGIGAVSWLFFSCQMCLGSFNLICVFEDKTVAPMHLFPWSKRKEEVRKLCFCLNWVPLPFCSFQFCWHNELVPSLRSAFLSAVFIAGLFNPLLLLCCYDRLPLEQRRNYTSVFNALYRITKEEGVLTLWRVRMCTLLMVKINWSVDQNDKMYVLQCSLSLQVTGPKLINFLST